MSTTWRRHLVLVALLGLVASAVLLLPIADLSLERMAHHLSPGALEGQGTEYLQKEDFESVPRLMDLGEELEAHFVPWAVRIIALLLLLLAALAMDYLVHCLCRSRPAARFTSLGPAGVLTLFWPSQVLLLLALRAALRLPIIALAFCLAVTLAARYLGLAAAGLVQAGGPTRGRLPGALLTLFGLGLHGGAVWLVARQGVGDVDAVTSMLPAVALSTPLVLLAAAVLGRGIPADALIICSVQALVGGLVLQGLGSGALWLAAVAAPLLIAVMVHVLKGRPRGGVLAKAMAVLGVVGVLLFFLELGLTASPGVGKIIGSSYGHLGGGLASNEHGDPLGLLKGAPEIQLKNGTYKVHAPPGTFRLACLGSSSTEGTGVTDLARDSYPSQLQELLKGQGLGQVEVINAGLSGATLTQLSVYLEEVVARLYPDAVVLYFGANLDTNESRRYYLNLRQTVAAAPYLRTTDELWAASRFPYHSPRAIKFYLMLAQSRLFMAVLALVEGAVARSQGRDMDSPAEEPSLLPETAKEVVESCVRKRIPLLLVPEVMRTSLLNPTMLHAGGIPHRTFHYTEVFRKLASKHHAAGVRFTSLHKTYSAENVRRFFVDEMHQNSEGYGDLAKKIAAALTSHGMLPALQAPTASPSP